MHDVTETVALNCGMDRACGGDSVEWMAIFLSKFYYFFIFQLQVLHGLFWPVPNNSLLLFDIFLV